MELQPISDSSEREKVPMSASLIGRRTTISRNSIDLQNRLVDPLDIPELKVKSSSLKEDSTPVIRIKPFIPPFERYFYFDFLWKVAYSNCIRA